MSPHNVRALERVITLIGSAAEAARAWGLSPTADDLRDAAATLETIRLEEAP